MKKFTIVLLFVLAIVLVGCSTPPAPVPWQRLSFKIEENPDYIGSYTIRRENLNSSWTEWGEWTPVEYLFERGIVCFDYFNYQEGNGTFYARSDYQWVERKYQGDICIELKKK